MWQWTLCLTAPSNTQTHHSWTRSTLFFILPVINYKWLLSLSSSVFPLGRHKDLKSQERNTNSLSGENRFPWKCLGWSFKNFVLFSECTILLHSLLLSVFWEDMLKKRVISWWLSSSWKGTNFLITKETGHGGKGLPLDKSEMSVLLRRRGTDTNLEE